jgi:hypothetical protein
LYVIFCLIITAHFRAHYLSLKTEVPRYLLRLLAFPLITGWVLSWTGEILLFLTQHRSYSIFIYVSKSSELLFITSLDLIGYLRIRKLLLEVMQLSLNERQSVVSNETWCLCLKKRPRSIEVVQEESETLSQMSTSPQRLPPLSVSVDDPRESSSLGGGGYGERGRGGGRGAIDHTQLMKKIFRFHFIVISLTLISLVFGATRSADEFRDLSGPPTYSSPDIYQFEYDLHVFLFAQFLFSWWGWIPLSSLRNNRSEAGSHSKDTTKVHSQTDPPGRHRPPSVPITPRADVAVMFPAEPLPSSTPSSPSTSHSFSHSHSQSDSHPSHSSTDLDNSNHVQEEMKGESRETVTTEMEITQIEI